MRLAPFPLTEREGLLGQAIQSHDLRLAAQARNELIARLGEIETFAWAKANGTDSILGHAPLDSASGDSPDTATCGRMDIFGAAHQAMSFRIRNFMAELDAVAAALHHNNIPMVALKNSGIARGIYTCAGCSPMGDLDLLIRPRDFRNAHRTLVDLGFQFKFRSTLEAEDLDHAEASGGSEYFRYLPNGEKLWVELQWRPVAGRWIRPDQEPSADDLIARSLAIPGTYARILSPVDNLLQVTLHTAKHTYVRAPGYRLHTDVDRIVTYCDIDWDELVRRIKTAQVCTAVYFSLALANELLETPIPRSVLASLRPASWKEARIRRWLGEVGLFFPDQPKFSSLRFLAFNALLYDDAIGLARAIFPRVSWMRQRYHCSTAAVPWYYLRRLSDLVCRRSLS